jgi:hypothetical protein
MNVKINNQFNVKQGLTISLEIARYELSSGQINRINAFINQLDNSFNNLNIQSTRELLNDVEECIQVFKKSETIKWIRDDFVKDIILLETYLCTERKSSF